jgi:phosphoglycerate dehydrogenase-like enzyme
MAKPKGIFILGLGQFENVYGPDEVRDLESRVDFVGEPQSVETLSKKMGLLAHVEVIFSSWGAPLLDKTFLKSCPKLKAFFYGAGSVKGFVTDDFWTRNIQLTSAASANAIPVAEFTLAQIIMSLNHTWRLTRTVRATASFPSKDKVFGCYKTTVGLIGMGFIAKSVLSLVKKTLDVNVKVYDPYLSEEDAKIMGITLCSLEELFKTSHVVSCHAPNIPQTQGMLKKEHFESMMEGSTFINTSRGALVDEPALIEVLRWRRDLTACLDVTHPEPPLQNSALYALPNVVLTPHVAGSVNNECRRMGRLMIEEFDRYIKGEPLQYALSKEKIEKMA